jgi:hypothetical protein
MFTVIFLASCANAESKKTLYVSGEINVSFTERLEKNNEQDIKLIVSSYGGLSSQAFLSAKNIIENQNTLVVTGLCISACAEYFLPSAKKVEFKNKPLVGFHWNAIMIEYLTKENAPRDVKNCNFSQSTKLNNLQRNMGVNNEFWKETISRLGWNKFIMHNRPNKCPNHSIEFEHQLWLPTSQQLREFYHLEFTGSVCADDPKCYEKRIDRTWRKGESFAVGDEVYVSKGWK